jgi:hypothetical protein
LARPRGELRSFQLRQLTARVFSTPRRLDRRWDPDDSELGAVWRASLTLGAYCQGVRILTLTGAAERSFWHDLAGNRPGLEDLDAPGRAGEKWPPTCDSFKRASARRAALALPGVRNWGTVTPIFPRVGLQSKAKLDAELKAGAGTQLLPWTSSVAWRLSIIVADMNPRSAPRLTFGAPMLLRFRPRPVALSKAA